MTAATTRRRWTPALKAADYAGFEARRAAAKARGKLRGIGISTYIEACGIAPSAVVGSLGARAGLYEVGTIRVHPTGSVTVLTGTHSHGQGHETTLAQLVCRPARRADGAGRHRAWRHRQDPLRHGHLWQPQPRGRRQRHGQGDGQDHRQGQAHRRPSDGSRGRGRRVRRAAPSASPAPTRPRSWPRSRWPPMCRTTTRSRRSSRASTRPPSTTRRTSPIPAAAISARSRSTRTPAWSQVVNFTAVDDVGRVINPMIVEGQVQGGVAQGIGQALLENAVYDAERPAAVRARSWTTPCRGPRTCRTSRVATDTTLCTHNPLGVKGCGEVGAIGSPPAVINAVVDALKDYGVRHIEMPATPQKTLVASSRRPAPGWRPS